MRMRDGADAVLSQDGMVRCSAPTARFRAGRCHHRHHWTRPGSPGTRPVVQTAVLT